MASPYSILKKHLKDTLTDQQLKLLNKHENDLNNIIHDEREKYKATRQQMDDNETILASQSMTIDDLTAENQEQEAIIAVHDKRDKRRLLMKSITFTPPKKADDEEGEDEEDEVKSKEDLVKKFTFDDDADEMIDKINFDAFLSPAGLDNDELKNTLKQFRADNPNITDTNAIFSGLIHQQRQLIEVVAATKDHIDEQTANNNAIHKTNAVVRGLRIFLIVLTNITY